MRPSVTHSGASLSLSVDGASLFLGDTLRRRDEIRSGLRAADPDNLLLRRKWHPPAGGLPPKFGGCRLPGLCSGQAKCRVVVASTICQCGALPLPSMRGSGTSRGPSRARREGRPARGWRSTPPPVSTRCSRCSRGCRSRRAARSTGRVPWRRRRSWSLGSTPLQSTCRCLLKRFPIRALMTGRARSVSVFCAPRGLQDVHVALLVLPACPSAKSGGGLGADQSPQSHVRHGTSRMAPRCTTEFTLPFILPV